LFTATNRFFTIRALILSAEKGSSDESSGIGKEDLRQVQGHYPQGSSKGDLRERKAQAAPGLVGSLAERGSFKRHFGKGLVSWSQGLR
jgi:hypothetical protein